MVLDEVSLMHVILAISNEIKSKVKVVLLEGSLINFIFRISKEIKLNVKVVLLEVSLMNFFFGFFQMEGESPVTRNLFHDLQFWDIQEIKWKVKVVLHEASLMNFILGITMGIKCKMKVVLLKVS